MREKVVLFGKTKALVGVLTFPDKTEEEGREQRAEGESSEGSNSLPAIIFLNAGLLHRVGPHRLYVKMARHFASMGFAVLRFDFSGIGDSQVRGDRLSWKKRWILEVGEAMDVLASETHVDRFILTGICSGADFALQVAMEDCRVVGAIPIECHSRLTTWYYLHHIRNPISWWRVLTGKKDARTTVMLGRHLIKSLLKKAESRIKGRSQEKKGLGGDNTKQVEPDANLAQNVFAAVERGIGVLLIYARGTPAYYNFVRYRSQLHGMKKFGKLQIAVIENSDHSFPLLSTQQDLRQVIQDWLVSRFNKKKKLSAVSRQLSAREEKGRE